MDVRLTHIFGQALRKTADGSILTPDGRVVSTASRGFALAEKLLGLDAEAYADEIVKLVAPLCFPFDRDDVKAALVQLGQREKEEQKAIEQESADGTDASPSGASVHMQQMS